MAANPSFVPYRFLGVEDQFAAYDMSRFVVLPIPYDATVSYKSGTREGPRAIIDASRQVELFDPVLGREIHEAGVHTCDPLETDARSPQHMHECIFAAAEPIVRDDKFLLGLGGEHSITSGLVRAVHQKYPDAGVLQIDAHLDLRDTWHDTPYSHACVMRRVADMGIPFVQVGIRNISAEEHDYLQETDRQPWTMNRINNAGGVHSPNCQGWIDQAIDALPDMVYVTIDVDGFDPSVAPGTGTPEPGGLSWTAGMRLLETLFRRRTVVAADIVEVLPIPGQHVTEFMAARLGASVISLAQQD